MIRNFGISSGEVIAEIDLTLIDKSRLFDFRNDAIRESFLGRYPGFRRQLERLAAEGVVAVEGDIASEAVLGLIRIPKPADAIVIRAAVQLLLGGEL